MYNFCCRSYMKIVALDGWYLGCVTNQVSKKVLLLHENFVLMFSWAHLITNVVSKFLNAMFKCRECRCFIIIVIKIYKTKSHLFIPKPQWYLSLFCRSLLVSESQELRYLVLSQVNVLGPRSNVRGFKPGRGRLIFSGRINSEHKSSRRDF